MKKTLSNTTYLYWVRTVMGKFNYCRAVDLSRHIWITPWSCSTGIKALIKKGMIKEDENKFLFLTDPAKNLLENLDKNREIFKMFIYSNTANLSVEDIEKLTKNFIHLVPQELIDSL